MSGSCPEMRSLAPRNRRCLKTGRRLMVLAVNQVIPAVARGLGQLAAGLDVSSPTIVRYIDLMVDLLLARLLQP